MKNNSIFNYLFFKVVVIIPMTFVKIKLITNTFRFFLQYHVFILLHNFF